MKRLLFVQHQAPHGTLYGQEGLDAILMGSAFAQCSLLLLDDGVFQLLDKQAPEVLGSKHYALSYGALFDYGVEHVYCSAKHLTRRGLTTEDLLIDVEPMSDEQIKDLLNDHDVILSF